MKERNRIEKQATDQQVVDGIRADLQGMPTLYLASKVFTPVTLEQQIQSRIDAAQAVDAAKAAWLAAIQAYQGIDRDNRLVLRDLKRLIIGAFGEQSPKLADFGFAPRKVTVLTPEEKAAAAAKRAATRKARNTMGPKAKLAVKGTVPATAPATPAAAPVAPNPQPTTPTPAPAAAQNTTPPAPPARRRPDAAHAVAAAARGSSDASLS